MKRYSKTTIASYKGTKKFKWAFNMLFVSISLSLFFGFISQTVLSNMGILIATIVICVFIFFAVIFDMLGVAVVSADIALFYKWQKENIKGSQAGYLLCKHCEKVCSFCGDVVGDICSTLCGAAGACIVMALSSRISLPVVSVFISVVVPALIAGITIFFKALMKEYALKKSNKIILKVGILMEKLIFKEKKCKKL